MAQQLGNFARFLSSAFSLDNDDFSQQHESELDLREQRLSDSGALYQSVSVDGGSSAMAQTVDQSTLIPPSSVPQYPFSFPISELPVKHAVRNNLTFDDFKHMKQLSTPGANAVIFLAKFGRETVIIKSIKPELQSSPMIMQEYDTEHGFLARLEHDSIVRILGAGTVPQRFVVLEYLKGGTLSTVLRRNRTTIGKYIYPKQTFTFKKVLQHAYNLADALNHMHRGCHPGGTILHRDLKPDNVGFTSDGRIKLLDFGLCSCVHTSLDSNVSYQMSGYTGSLRYMAPEVALKKPYNEKVDVYSFGVMLWQMASDDLPFDGLTRAEFMQEVMRGTLRPDMDPNWPQAFIDLISQCWQRNPNRRPSFVMIQRLLWELITSKKRVKSNSILPMNDTSTFVQHYDTSYAPRFDAKPEPEPLNANQSSGMLPPFFGLHGGYRIAAPDVTDSAGGGFAESPFVSKPHGMGADDEDAGQMIKRGRRDHEGLQPL